MLLPRLTAVLTLVLVLPVTARAAELDPFLPADTESYVSINVRQFVDSPIFKKQLLAPAQQMLKDAREVDDVLRDLGFDPFKHLDRIIVASPTGTETDRGLIIVHGTFDRAKFEKKADDTVRDNADVMKIHKVPLGGGATHVVYEVVIPNQDQSLFVSLIENKALLASPGKDYVVDAIKAHRLKKKPVLKNKDFQALLQKMDPKLTVSMAVLGKALANGGNNELLPQAATEALKNIEAIGGGILVSNEFKAELVVVSKDAQSAKVVRDASDRFLKLGLVGLALLGEENKELALLLEVVKTIKVSGTGKTVALSARLTADVLEDFFKKGE